MNNLKFKWLSSLLVSTCLFVGVGGVQAQSNLTTSLNPAHTPITAGAMLSLLLVVGLIGYSGNHWRKRPQVDQRTPRQRALDTLDVLDLQNLQTPEELMVACVSIAGCLRAYISSMTTIPARDLTTNELARQLKHSDLPADWSARVIDVLRVCDSVKFVRDVLELTTVHGLINTVRMLVEQYPPKSTFA